MLKINKKTKRLDRASSLRVSESLSLEGVLALLARYRDEGLKAKFDETVDIVFSYHRAEIAKLQQPIRGVVPMPEGLGRPDVKVLAFVSEAYESAAKQAGAYMVGGEGLIEKIKAGERGFESCVASPDMLDKVVASLGRILGPQGLLPSARTGTVLSNPETLSEKIKAIRFGTVEYKMDKGGNIHAPVGKLSFASDKLANNLKTLIRAVNESVSNAKLRLKKVCLSTSQGVPFELDISNI